MKTGAREPKPRVAALNRDPNLDATVTQNPDLPAELLDHIVDLYTTKQTRSTVAALSPGHGFPAFDGFFSPMSSSRTWRTCKPGETRFRTLKLPPHVTPSLSSLDASEQILPQTLK